MEEEKIKSIMQSLECSREEAIQVILDDKEIDKGKDLFPLTEEQQKESKKARITTSETVNAYGKKVSREKKENPQKKAIIKTLITALNYESIDIINEEREFTFFQEGKKFKIVLSCPRK